jgi:hypothetical protein
VEESLERRGGQSGTSIFRIESFMHNGALGVFIFIFKKKIPNERQEIGYKNTHTNRLGWTFL